VYEYMRALYHRFEAFGETAKELEQEVDQAYNSLRERLGKEERTLLLKLEDLTAEFLDESCLDCFVAGYRLAMGIQQELSMQAPYSFVLEDEHGALRQSEGK